MRRGYDFADEGYYIGLTLFPSEYVVGQSFGHINALFLSWMPLWAFRLAGGMLFVITGIGFAVKSELRFPKKILFAVMVAVSCIGHYKHWLPTPSYNFWTVLCCLWLVACWTTVSDSGRIVRLSLLSGAIIATLFYVKITSGFTAFLIVCSLVAISEDRIRRLGIIATGGIFGLIVNWAIGAPFPWTHIFRLIELDSIGAGTGHGLVPSMIRAWEFICSLVNQFRWFDWSLVAFSGLKCCPRIPKRVKVVITWVAILAFLLILVNGIIGSVVRTNPTVTAYVFLKLWLIGSILTINSTQAACHYLVAFLFAFCAVFGTNNEYGGFMLICSPILMFPLIYSSFDSGSKAEKLVPIMLNVYLVVTVLDLVISNPYGQGGNWQSLTSKVDLANGLGSVNVTRDRADLIRSAQSAFGGLSPMVIDLTGGSPGLILAAGGRSAGDPWLIGGYPNSVDRALLALGRLSSSELEDCWILDESDGKRKLPNSLLAELGLNDRPGKTIVFSGEGRDFTLWVPSKIEL